MRLPGLFFLSGRSGFFGRPGLPLFFFFRFCFFSALRAQLLSAVFAESGAPFIFISAELASHNLRLTFQIYDYSFFPQPEQNLAPGFRGRPQSGQQSGIWSGGETGSSADPSGMGAKGSLHESGPAGASDSSAGPSGMGGTGRGQGSCSGKEGS